MATVGASGPDAANTLPPIMSGTGAGVQAAMTPQDNIAAAASGDQFEIQSSQLVLERSRNEEVKRFARLMVEDHRSSTQRLKAVSQQAGLNAPLPAMLAAHQTKLDELRAATTNMDQIYLGQQREAHAQAIALYEAIGSAEGMPKPLGLFAREILPKVQAHAAMLTKMNIPTAAN
ncbi:DUF4142 domain-containing protein [Sandarakinorhabdus sp.]|uniref:DUF4142 domain-containing protein n=1 Tax=Sandarakinorhabdus sp. TaxID=1916663 RepID=UPI003561A4DD